MDKIDPHWDYSKQAKYYEYRPNYSPKAIDFLVWWVSEQGKKKDFKVADLGAGTGNLTILLLNRGLFVYAVEPNDAMMGIGKERTKKYSNVKWIRATATETELPSKSCDWVAFGSSFNVVDRDKAIIEVYRILKNGGYMACMWNHRELEDPIQKMAEEIILRYVPDYERGVRREDQKPFFKKHQNLFDELFYIEVDFYVERTIDEYIKAWKSVRNKYWEPDDEIFKKLEKDWRKSLPSSFTIKYTTRAWTVKKK